MEARSDYYTFFLDYDFEKKEDLKQEQMHLYGPHYLYDS
jgi:hypothetical protein